MKRKFNHALTLAFEAISERKDGDDLTPAMLRAALMRRIIQLDEEGAWLEACLAPFDTYEMEGEND